MRLTAIDDVGQPHIGYTLMRNEFRAFETLMVRLDHERRPAGSLRKTSRTDLDVRMENDLPSAVGRRPDGCDLVVAEDGEAPLAIG